MFTLESPYGHFTLKLKYIIGLNIQWIHPSMGLNLCLYNFNIYIKFWQDFNLNKKDIHLIKMDFETK